MASRAEAKAIAGMVDTWSGVLQELALDQDAVTTSPAEYATAEKKLGELFDRVLGDWPEVDRTLAKVDGGPAS